MSSLIAAATLSAMSMFAPTASALNGDNVHALVSDSGSMNCVGGDTCVEKVGDTATVEWTIQATHLVSSSDSSQSSGDPILFIPKAVKNLEVTLNALPDDEAWQQLQLSDEALVGIGSTSTTSFYPYQVVDTQIPVLEADSDVSPVNSLKTDRSQWGIKKLNDADKFDHKAAFAENARGGQSVDNMTSDQWDIYDLGVKSGGGITTFTVRGEVETQLEETYIPIRVHNVTKHCLDTVCDALATYNWADMGLVPEFSLTDPEVNARVAQLQTPQGRLGNPKCSPTSETGDYGRIGWDNLQPASYIRSEKYAETFSLHLNPAVTYIIPGFTVYEDSCDQADFLITICDKADEEVPPSEEPSTTPSTEESSQPSEPEESSQPSEPEESSQPSEPEVSDEPEESTAVSTPKDEAPNNENGEESNPTPEAQAQAQAQVNIVSNGSKQQTAQQQASPQARNLPVTGSSTGLLVAGGVALLGVIAGGVYYATRRKSANE